MELCPGCHHAYPGHWCGLVARDESTVPQGGSVFFANLGAMGLCGVGLGPRTSVARSQYSRDLVGCQAYILAALAYRSRSEEGRGIPGSQLFEESLALDGNRGDNPGACRNGSPLPSLENRFDLSVFLGYNRLAVSECAHLTRFESW